MIIGFTRSSIHWKNIRLQKTITKRKLKGEYFFQKKYNNKTKMNHQGKTPLRLVAKKKMQTDIRESSMLISFTF